MKESGAGKKEVRQPGQATPPPLREDLNTKPARYLGRDFVVLKNPVSLEYFRLAQHLYEAARLFDGKRELISILRELQERERSWSVLTEEDGMALLAQLVNQLGFQGLLQTSADHNLSRLEQRRALRRSRRLEIVVGKSMFFRKSLCDPDALLGKILPYVRWVFTGWFALFFLILGVSAAVAVGLNLEKAAGHVGSFFTLHNLLLAWVILILIKTLHEFGHGVTSKYFGGEVHEMGILMIIFTPYFYCNVSDAWMLPERRQRMLVGAAGILVELFVAAIAAWLWVLTQPGFFNQTCFNLMVMCSVSTFIFNANPLLKFDGYYIMADYLQIPNLKQKSNEYVTQWAQRRLLGLRATREGFLAHEAGTWFGLYAVASYFYMWIILFGISFYLFNVLEPYGLEAFSRIYVGLFMATVLVLPFYRLLRTVQSQREVWPLIGKRIGAVAALLLLLGAGTFFLPWTDTIRQSGVVKHVQVEQVSAPVSGFIREVLVRDGERVEAGQALIRIENRDLDFHRRDLELEIAALGVDLQTARVRGQSEGYGPAFYQQRLAEVEEELRLLDTRLAEMWIRAPKSGVIRGWGLAHLEGHYLRRGELICSIGVEDGLRLVVSLNQDEAERIREGSSATARFFAFPGRESHGRLVRAPVARAATFADENISGLGGTTIPTMVAPDGRVRPAVAYFEAEVVLTDPEHLLREGMVARVKIVGGETTLGRWAFDRVLGVSDGKIRL